MGTWIVLSALLAACVPAFALNADGPVPAAAHADLADLLEARHRLLDDIAGWQALAAAPESQAADLAGGLGPLKTAAERVNPAAQGLKAAQTALERARINFEAWKQNAVARLFAVRRNGRRFEDAGREESAEFYALVEGQAEALRRAKSFIVQSGQYAALQKRVLDADNPGQLFDNDAFDPKVQISDRLAVPFAETAPQPILRAMAREYFASQEPSAPVRTQDDAEPATRAPDVASTRPETRGVPPPASAGSRDGKRSWQREILVRTGAWDLFVKAGVDPERFIAFLTGAESGYQTDITSNKGAAGVMQVMPGTARGIMTDRRYNYAQLARDYGLPVYQASNMNDDKIQRMLNTDWRTNILLGVLYIHRQAADFGDKLDGLRVSIAQKAHLMMNMVAGAYNAGPGALSKYLRRLSSRGISLADINPSQSIVGYNHKGWYGETKGYVRRILSGYGWGLFGAAKAAHSNG